MLDRITQKMAEREGVNEELKATDQMKCVSRMNLIKSRVPIFTQS